MPRPISPKWISASCRSLPVQITLGGPNSQWKAMQQLYFFMIMTAERKVQITSPFFVPDASLLEAIKAVALSGVQVEIMVSKHGTVLELAHRATFTYLADVVRSGAKVYLYDKGYFHSKTINIDSQVCAIGTANFDIRSFSLNYEAMAVLYDKDLAVQLGLLSRRPEPAKNSAWKCTRPPHSAPPAQSTAPAGLPAFVTTASPLI